MHLQSFIDLPFRLMHFNRFSRPVKLFLLGSFLVGIGQNFWSLFFNLMMQSAGWTKQDIGGTLAYQQLASLLLSIPAAIMLGRFATRRLLVPSVGAGIILLSAAVWIPNIAWMRGLVFWGFGGLVVQRVLANVFFVKHSTPQERDYVFSASFTLNTFGAILGNMAAGFVKQTILSDPTWGLGPVTGYRLTIALGLGLAALAVWPFALIDDPTPTKVPFKLSWQKLRELDWPFLVKALIPNILIGIGAGLVIQFMTLYFRDQFNTSDASMGAYMAGMSAAMMIAYVLSPMMAERWGRVPTIVATQLASLPFMLVLGYTRSLPMAVMAFVTRGVLMNMAGPIGSSLIMDLCPENQRAILNALANMSIAFSWGLSALMFGGVLKGDYRVTFAIACMLYFVASILYYVFFAETDRLSRRKTL